MAIAFLGLGTNIGNKRKNLIIASSIIAERVGDVLTLSSFYETEPWGFESDNKFLNAVIKIRTELMPLQLLEATKAIEVELGRLNKTTEAYEDRIIDIDILLYDQLQMKSEELTIPHPHMHERKFVMEPLAEIAPFLIHPVLKERITDLNEKL